MNKWITLDYEININDTNNKLCGDCQYLDYDNDEAECILFDEHLVCIPLENDNVEICRSLSCIKKENK
jgi:hypothetical protein